ncbi:Protein FAR1-RELATED SEQUENCE 5, partial [Linum grandiflorum]
RVLIRFQLNETLDLYYISAWVGKHNHQKNPKGFAHLLVSNRRVSPTNGMMMEMNAAACITLRSSFEIICATTGGVENVGCTKVDHKNHLARIRQRQMIRGEATIIAEYLREKARLCPGFWHEVEVDAEENIANIFWADQRMREDYASFGDSITFDTTFRTNKHYRPLALFVGFNNYHQGVVFGAALLYDETIPSFVWLFRAFLRCMHSKAPATIFTDQDATMANAIHQALPKTFHALCTFHIIQNARRNLGAALCTQEFVKRLLFLFYNVDSVEEFDEVWASMMQEFFPSYGEVGHPWCQKIVKLREKWSSVWVKNHYTAGMVSTQLVESCNATVRGFLSHDISLVDFFTHFER